MGGYEKRFRTALNRIARADDVKEAVRIARNALRGTKEVPGSTESVADAAEATAPGLAESVAPDPSPVGSESSGGAA